jgi:hypothetical protein
LTSVRSVGGCMLFGSFWTMSSMAWRVCQLSSSRRPSMRGGVSPT